VNAGPTFVLTLVAPPGTDAIRGLRWLLKTAWRRFGLRCVEAREIPSSEGPTTTRSGLEYYSP